MIGFLRKFMRHSNVSNMIVKVLNNLKIFKQNVQNV